MNMLNRLLPFVAGLILVTPARATVITFDDLQGAGYLPANYAGLTWGPAWQYYDTVQAPYNAASGFERIYSYSFGGFIDFGQNVTFHGSWLASADAGQQMWWEGYSNGVKIFESQHYAGGSQLFINLNWAGVDYVKFVDSAENHFVLDNISYDPITIAAVPDAVPTALLFALAAFPLLILSGVRQSRNGKDAVPASLISR
jgi:hypothetical protein